MRAITVRDREADGYGLSLSELPYPHAAENDVIVQVHAAGFTRGELDWPGTWTDRAGRDRTPSVPGHELSGVVAEFVAVEARNLAPISADVDHIAAAALPIAGLTAWQALFDHADLKSGQTVLIHGAGGSVGSVAVQLARETGAQIIGTGRASDRDLAGTLGVHEFLDLDGDSLEDAGEVDVVLDVIGGAIRDRSTALLRPGGTLVTIADPPTVHPRDGRAIFFVVEPNREQLVRLAARLRDGRLTPLVTAVRDLAAVPTVFAERTRGRIIITVTS